MRRVFPAGEPAPGRGAAGAGRARHFDRPGVFEADFLASESSGWSAKVSAVHTSCRSRPAIKVEVDSGHRLAGRDRRRADPERQRRLGGQRTGAGAAAVQDHLPDRHRRAARRRRRGDRFDQPVHRVRRADAPAVAALRHEGEDRADQRPADDLAACVVGLDHPPDELAKELFTHQGSGTLVRRGERVSAASIPGKQLDLQRLRALIESSFGRKLASDYFQTHQAVRRSSSARHYRAALILTLEDGIRYLDKFAVCDDAQGEGLGRAAWQVMRDDHAAAVLALARTTIRSTSSTYDESDGCMKRREVERVLVRPGDIRPDPLRGRSLPGAAGHLEESMSMAVDRVPTTHWIEPVLLQGRHVRLGAAGRRPCRRVFVRRRATANCGASGTPRCRRPRPCRTTWIRRWRFARPGPRCRGPCWMPTARWSAAPGTAMSMPAIVALEIGWTWYARGVQRTGLNTEAKLLLLTHAFESAGLRRSGISKPAGSTMPRETRSRGWARSRTACCAITSPCRR